MLISSSGSEEGNKFPVTIADHCSFLPYQLKPCYCDWWISRWVKIYLHLVCGLDYYKSHTRTNHENRKKLAWLFHFPRWNQTYGIVSGGIDNSGLLDSTEMINLDQEIPTWTEGMQDKSKIV